MNRLRRGLQGALLYRRGRPAALAMLLAAAAAAWVSNGRVLPGDAEAPRRWAWAESAAAPLALLRQALFDSYQLAFPRVRQAEPVTIVEVDERSLQAIGQWPWPRNRLADLVDAVAAHRPAAVGLDIYMPEADQTSPERVAQNLPAGSEALADALAKLPSHELRLAQALHGAPTVLSAAGFDTRSFATNEGLLTRAAELRGGDPLPYLRRFVQVLSSMPELQRAAHGQGVVSVDSRDAVVRRVPLAVVVNDQVVPSLAMEMLRVAYDRPAVALDVGRHGIERVVAAVHAVPTQPRGDIWVHFARHATAVPREVSAADVLAQRVPAEALAGKLVLIGLTGLGLSDTRLTPLGEAVPGVEIQAQLLESIVDGRLLLRPWWMRGVEFAVLLAVGGTMVWLVPLAYRRATGGRVAERRRWSGWVLGTGALVLAAGYALFRANGLMFDPGGVLVGMVLLSGVLASSAVLEIERDNGRLASEQLRLREEAAQVASELAVARRIQLGTLPDARLAFPGERRFEIATLMEPAREVGGDLYDFFLIDEQRLCFVIGDVSGKGLPASLFMAVTKTLTKSFALRMAGGPQQVVAAANEDLARENSELLFVTLLLGVLDADSGALELVNAGHDAPWLSGADGALRQLSPPPGTGGPPLCVLEGIDYLPQQLQLASGDTLYLATDGITEAMNAEGEFYGGARLQALLAGLPPGLPVRAVTQRVRDDVARFVGDAEPSDDLTLLVLRWHGPGGVPAPDDAGGAL